MICSRHRHLPDESPDLGHSIQTMLSTYARWTEGATESDIGTIKQAMERSPIPVCTTGPSNPLGAPETAKSELKRYTLDGVPDHVVQLPGIGSVITVTGDLQDPEAFFVFASFNQPNTVFRYDVSTNTQSAWIEPKIAADLEQISVEQCFIDPRTARAFQCSLSGGRMCRAPRRRCSPPTAPSRSPHHRPTPPC